MIFVQKANKINSIFLKDKKVRLIGIKLCNNRNNLTSIPAWMRSRLAILYGEYTKKLFYGKILTISSKLNFVMNKLIIFFFMILNICMIFIELPRAKVQCHRIRYKVPNWRMLIHVIDCYSQFYVTAMEKIYHSTGLFVLKHVSLTYYIE